MSTKNVEEIIPPTIVKAKGFHKLLPDNTIGSKPKIVVTEVIKIGKNRCCALFITASLMVSPSFLIKLLKVSTSNMELLITIPEILVKPIKARNENDLLNRNNKNMAPIKARGIAIKTMNG